MSAEWLSILALVALFVVGTLLPINMGALGFVAAWLVGTYALGLSEREIIDGISGDLVLTLVGVTYLFAIAQRNGTVDVLVQSAVRVVGSKVALIPWIMFAITALITAVGALSPAAVAIIAPIALNFAQKYRISPLLMGMMVIHGAQGGGFSPIAVYGVTVNGIVNAAGLEVSPLAVFLSSLIFNVLISVVLFLVLGGRGLMSSRAEDFVARAAEARMSRSKLISATAGERDVDFKGFGSGMYGPTDPAGSSAAPAAQGTRIGVPQVATLLGLAALAVVALGFGVDVGFVAITVAVLLALVSPQAQKGAVNKVDWSTVLLLGGMLTFVGVLQEAGTIEYVSDGVASLGIPLIAALLICYIGGVVSAFASSTAILAALIPLAVPFLQAGEVGATGLICALAVSSTIVDVSPFSTNGALVLANAPENVDRDRFYRQILLYAGIVVVAGPLLVWAAMVLPGWW